MTEPGKIIIFEGVDGSGKSTQYRMVCDKLTAMGCSYRNIVFPRYEKESSALIRSYLNGEFGNKPEDVNAYSASLFYAVDRYASYKDDWGRDFESGKLIIGDRYTTSNIIHQAAKLPDSEITDYFTWVTDIEFNKMGLPSPNHVFYLDIDIDTALRRIRKRRIDTNTKGDIHENDISYLCRCIEIGRYACTFFGWEKVAFEINGNERQTEEKNSEIFTSLIKLIS